MTVPDLPADGLQGRPGTSGLPVRLSRAHRGAQTLTVPRRILDHELHKLRPLTQPARKAGAATGVAMRVAFTTSCATAPTAMTTYSSFIEGDGAVQVAASVLLSRAVSRRAKKCNQTEIRQ